MIYTTKTFWIDTTERVISTFAQGVLASFGTGAIGLLEVNWTIALSVGGFAALTSFLKAAVAVRKTDTASLVDLEKIDRGY